MKDEVNSPEHYTSGGIECIDAIEAALTPEEFCGYLKGNIMKYVWRERKKGGAQSIAKAKWYLNRLLTHKVKHESPPVLNVRADELDAFDKVEAYHFWQERA